MIKDIIENNELAQAGGKEISVLKRYFPQCFTSDGKFDIEAFKASLPEDTDITDETSGFSWQKLCPYAHQYGHNHHHPP